GTPGEPLAIGPEEHNFVGPAAADGQESLVPADRDSMRIGDGLAPGIERERGEGGVRPIEIDPGQALAEDPADVDVIPGRGEPAILHVGDVARLAVGGDDDLAEVVAVDR